MKVNEGKKKRFFYGSKCRSPEPNGVLECWIIGEMVKFSHPLLHQSTTPSLHHSCFEFGRIKANQTKSSYFLGRILASFSSFADKGVFLGVDSNPMFRVAGGSGSGYFDRDL
jgi:hypothetical protein